MKYTFLILILFFPFFLLAQEYSIISNEADFFGIKKFDFDADTSKNFEIIKFDEKNISYRRFFPTTKVVSEEYLYLQKDTFLYLKYSFEDHKILIRGKLFPKNCCIRYDTIVTYDPYTYEEKKEVINYLKWSKEGFWIENGFDYGYYTDNHRVREWYVFDERVHQFKYVHYDNEGNIQETEPYDIIDAKNKDKTLERLQGQWAIRPQSTKKKISLMKILQNTSTYFPELTFNKDSVSIKGFYYCGESPINREKNKFELNNEWILYLNIAYFGNKKYKIISLSRYEMEWELVE